jgi:hypothetical protein
VFGSGPAPASRSSSGYLAQSLRSGLSSRPPGPASDGLGSGFQSGVGGGRGAKGAVEFPHGGCEDELARLLAGAEAAVPGIPRSLVVAGDAPSAPVAVPSPTSGRSRATSIATNRPADVGTLPAPRIDARACPIRAMWRSHHPLGLWRGVSGWSAPGASPTRATGELPHPCWFPSHTIERHETVVSPPRGIERRPVGGKRLSWRRTRTVAAAQHHPRRIAPQGRETGTETRRSGNEGALSIWHESC